MVALRLMCCYTAMFQMLRVLTDNDLRRATEAVASKPAAQLPKSSRPRVQLVSRHSCVPDRLLGFFPSVVADIALRLGPNIGISRQTNKKNSA